MNFFNKPFNNLPIITAAKYNTKIYAAKTSLLEVKTVFPSMIFGTERTVDYFFSNKRSFLLNRIYPQLFAKLSACCEKI